VATGQKRWLEGLDWQYFGRVLWKPRRDPTLEPATTSLSSAASPELAIPAATFTMSPVARETAVDHRQEILRTAARLFQQRGYDATSMNDVAAALKLSKGGLYHHFQSKDEILFEIMNHAMDITEERVVKPVHGIADPEERLRALIRRHIEVVLSPQDREITVMLHENHPLPPSLRKRINARKKEYVHFLERLLAEVQQKRNQKHSNTSENPSKSRFAKGRVSPRAAAFALLGMINWIYQWHKPEGELQAQNLIPQFTDLVFGGIFA
jgi:TetR/AcrR family transcriptional regulator, cholesterol catabolism regulator